MVATSAANPPEKAPSRAIPYYAGLDGLRAIAVILVLLLHARALLGIPSEILHSPAWRWTAGGWMGVDLFFVTSGFLITSILITIRSRRQSLKIFWLRRGLRIFPLYYLYLFVLIGISYSSLSVGYPDLPDKIWQWLPFFIYAGNFGLIFMPPNPVETIILWTLSVEEQFYAIWPILFAKLSHVELYRLSLWLIVL
ncbi:MAG: acyltransferase family protein, partial [Bradymonadaceae bacterium]